MVSNCCPNEGLIKPFRFASARPSEPRNLINSSMSPSILPITTEDYLDLIDWTAQLTRADKRGSVDAAEPPILRTLGLNEHQ